MRGLHRLWHDRATNNAVPRRVEVESARFNGPQAFENLDERRCSLVTLGVGQESDPHHLEFFFTPATDNIDPPATSADVVESSAHLGRHQRMERRYMNS